MDRVPLVEVNVNEGLESTLSVLGYRLGSVGVTRDYDPNLPRITAYGGELNQVWTQLLENALDAVAQNGGPGRIRLRTTCEADRVLVEVADNGPGIPEESCRNASSSPSTRPRAWERGRGWGSRHQLPNRRGPPRRRRAGSIRAGRHAFPGAPAARRGWRGERGVVEHLELLIFGLLVGRLRLSAPPLRRPGRRCRR
jgi:hypothetical protein